ncbi:MAG: hypothetical protein Q7N50_00030 [Armatimonadota bacterium]|nr:hypothetical protein [Armatimonadota bacterium]
MRSSRRRKLSPIAYLAAGILIIGLLVAARLATYTPPEEPEIITWSEAEHARQAIEAAERELEEASQAAKAGEKKSFQVSIAQQDATNFLRTDKSAAGVLANRKVEKPRIEFQSDRVNGSGYVTFHGRRVYVTVSGQLSHATGGKIAFRSDSVTVGKLPAPGQLAAKVDEMINAYIAFGPSVLPAQITEISSDGGMLTLKGVSDPASLRNTSR